MQHCTLNAVLSSLDEEGGGSLDNSAPGTEWGGVDGTGRAPSSLFVEGTGRKHGKHRCEKCIARGFSCPTNPWGLSPGQGGVEHSAQSELIPDPRELDVQKPESPGEV